MIMTPSGHEMGCTLQDAQTAELASHTEHGQHGKLFALCNMSNISLIHTIDLITLHSFQCTTIFLIVTWLFKNLIQFWENPDGNTIKGCINNRLLEMIYSGCCINIISSAFKKSQQSYIYCGNDTVIL